MTEDDAKTKLCPTIRYCVNEADAIHGHVPPLYVSALCQGSACMAWREERPIPLDHGASLKRPGHGHCGLGGKP